MRLHLGARAQGPGLARPEREQHVQARAGLGHGGRGQPLAARHGLARQAGQGHGAALAGMGLLHALVLRVQAAHARAQWRAAAAGADGQLVAHTHAAGVDGAGDHGSLAIQREGAVYGQAQALRGAGRRCLWLPLGGVEQQLAQRRNAAAGLRRYVDNGCAGQRCALQQSRHLGVQGLQPVRAGAVGLGDDHGAARDAQQRQHGQVLVRLRHGAVIGGHQQQRVIDAAGAGDHGVHQAFVAGHVDEADAPARGRVQVGVAQLYADAALFLLGQAVGVHAGEGAHQRGLAVVDMACGAYNHFDSCQRLSDKRKRPI